MQKYENVEVNKLAFTYIYVKIYVNITVRVYSVPVIDVLLLCNQYN